MKTMFQNASVVCALLALSSACVATKTVAANRDPEAAKQAFETLKSLAGRWEGTATFGTEQAPVSLSFEVVSADSTVMERLFVGTPHEMITMYHRDGDSVMMTHYCAVGNQPRMELQGWTAEPEVTMSFGFKDASNWAGEDQIIMHDMRLTKISDDHISSNWMAWKDGKLDHIGNFDFLRVPTDESMQRLKALGYAGN